MISSIVSHNAPTAGVTNSGSAPRRVPNTGVPESRASTLTRPNGSSHWAGFHRQRARASRAALRSEEHTSELQSHSDLVCRLLLEKKKKKKKQKRQKKNTKTKPKKYKI